MTDKYDVAIIGSGPGGYGAAIKAAKLGLRVCVAEKDAIGGTCLNYGCIPTKALLSQAVNSKKEGYIALVRKTQSTIEQLQAGIVDSFNKNKITVIQGKARILSPNEVKIESDTQNEQVLEAKNIIIATGSKPKELKNFAFNGRNILSSKDILSIQRPPEKILIIGAGAEGVEFATLFNMLGVKVTLAEKMEYILPGEDVEVSRRLEAYFKRYKIDVLTSVADDDLSKYKEGCVLVCAGRYPATDELGLDKLNIRLKRNFIDVDDYLKTGIPNIYAAGDVIGLGLAHTASYEGSLAAENISGANKKRDYTVVPRCVFTYTEIASIGATHTELEKAGCDFKAVKFPYSAIGISHCAGKTDGFIKLIADKNKNEILGASIIGHQATTLIQIIALAMKFKVSLKDLSETITAHPTFPELIKEAAASLFGKTIHSVIY